MLLLPPRRLSYSNCFWMLGVWMVVNLLQDFVFLCDDQICKMNSDTGNFEGCFQKLYYIAKSTVSQTFTSYWLGYATIKHIESEFANESN